MTDAAAAAETFGDPTTAPFWAAARQRRLVIQRCATCGHHQFYPRPHCLSCESADLAWVPAAGHGTIYSMTTTHVQVYPDLAPPYVVALVELAEGPRLLTNIVGAPCRIGDAVRLAWRERADAPPLPVFERAEGGR
ncbi:MAG: OB-fold domain-containing protein [Dongiaceae bacterium]